MASTTSDNEAIPLKRQRADDDDEPREMVATTIPITTKEDVSSNGDPQQLSEVKS